MEELLDAWVDEHRERLVRTLADFVRIPSVASDAVAVGAAVGFLTSRLEEAGLAVVVHETAGNPIVEATTESPADAFGVLVYGHYDVFPADEPEWRTPPFEPRVEGDRMWGRGTGDNKGQILTYVHAFEALADLDLLPPMKVTFLVEGEEEVGSPTLPEFVRRHRDRLQADLCLYSDGPMYPGDRPVLLFGVRGAVGIELVARGATRNVHSGNFGGVVPAPALELCRTLASLVDEEGRLTFDGADHGVAESTEADRAALAQLPLDLDAFRGELGVDPVSGPDPADFYERLLCRPNLNVAGLSSGHAGPRFKPAVPCVATAQIDVRLVGDQDPDAVFEAVRRHVARRAPEIEVRKLFGQPPSTTPTDHPLAAPVADGVERAFRIRPLDVPRLAGTTPDYVFTRLLGLPSIVVPLAPNDESNHAPNESTRLSIYLTGTKAVAHVLVALGAAGRARAGAADRIDPNGRSLMTVTADLAAREATRMELAYLEYRRACYAIVYRHARERGLLRALERPLTLGQIVAELGFLQARRDILELILNALVRLGAVRLDDQRYTAVPKFSEAGLGLDPTLIAEAIGVEQLESLLHGKNYSGIIDTLFTEKNAIAADFSAGNLPIWDEFLQQPFYRYGRECAADAVATPGGRVLDLACGPGYGLRELGERVGENGLVLGADVSRAFVAEAVTRTADLPHVRVLHADLDDGLPYLRDSLFDGAILVGAFHFLNRPETFFGEAARILRPGGALAVAYVYSQRGSFDQEIMDLRFALREPRAVPPEPSEVVDLAAAHGFSQRDELTMGCFTTFVFEGR
jgi:acetylornithine deacetylase/succinyl-diaminopimelate desuccinylase-like protein/SAM-dependent methyltransferase